MKLEQNQIRLLLPDGNTLSIVQNRFQDDQGNWTDATYSHHGVSCEIAVLTPDGAFVNMDPHKQVDEDGVPMTEVEGWVTPLRLAQIISEYCKELT